MYMRPTYQVTIACDFSQDLVILRMLSNVMLGHFWPKILQIGKSIEYAQ